MAPLERTFVRWMSFRDPPDHTRVRRLVTGSSTPVAIEGLRNVINDTIDELLPQDDRDSITI
jgi:cytochrome P450